MSAIAQKHDRFRFRNRERAPSAMHQFDDYFVVVADFIVISSLDNGNSDHFNTEGIEKMKNMNA